MVHVVHAVQPQLLVVHFLQVNNVEGSVHVAHLNPPVEEELDCFVVVPQILPFDLVRHPTPEAFQAIAAQLDVLEKHVKPFQQLLDVVRAKILIVFYVQFHCFQNYFCNLYRGVEHPNTKPSNGVGHGGA